MSIRRLVVPTSTWCLLLAAWAGSGFGAEGTDVPLTPAPEHNQPVAAATVDLGVFTAHQDVGAPDLAGSAAWDASNQSYQVRGAGRNVWATADQFHFVRRTITGDFILQARGRFPQPGTDKHRKFGLMVRAGFATDAAHVNAVVHGDGLTSLQFRRTAGAQTEELPSSVTSADVVQLERRGQRYLMSVARHGEPLTVSEVADVTLPDTVELGLFVCSHNKEVMEAAVFTQVRLILPAASPTKSAAGPATVNQGSYLEILSLADGARHVVMQTTQHIEAPNWTPDGASLIYNGSGRLHRFDLASATSTPIDTGSAERLNNDHLVSADGKWFAISHHSAQHNKQSVISVLPSTGGQSRLVTTTGPSYLHGWSPDGATLLFVGKREADADYNIYAIPIAGGAETRLCEAPGLDDGCEFSPDGKTIWFNSSRSGSMQLWRMDPDGGNPTQVTNDDRQNWFPHVSPDGSQVVFLSYDASVPADKHPPGKQVTLRVMPTSGGGARVVAYVFGGQGTLNVPSWSPDGRRIAFVSYGQ
jgi:TolB protein